MVPGKSLGAPGKARGCASLGELAELRSRAEAAPGWQPGTDGYRGAGFVH